MLMEELQLNSERKNIQAKTLQEDANQVLQELQQERSHSYPFLSMFRNIQHKIFELSAVSFLVLKPML